MYGYYPVHWIERTSIFSPFFSVAHSLHNNILNVWRFNIPLSLFTISSIPASSQLIHCISCCWKWKKRESNRKNSWTVWTCIICRVFNEENSEKQQKKEKTKQNIKFLAALDYVLQYICWYAHAGNVWSCGAVCMCTSLYVVRNIVCTPFDRSVRVAYLSLQLI